MIENNEEMKKGYIQRVLPAEQSVGHILPRADGHWTVNHGVGYFSAKDILFKEWQGDYKQEKNCLYGELERGLCEKLIGLLRYYG